MKPAVFVKKEKNPVKLKEKEKKKREERWRLFRSEENVSKHMKRRQQKNNGLEKDY